MPSVRRPFSSRVPPLAKPESTEPLRLAVLAALLGADARGVLRAADQVPLRLANVQLGSRAHPRRGGRPPAGRPGRVAHRADRRLWRRHLRPAQPLALGQASRLPPSASKSLPSPVATLEETRATARGQTRGRAQSSRRPLEAALCSSEGGAATSSRLAGLSAMPWLCGALSLTGTRPLSATGPVTSPVQPLSSGRPVSPCSRTVLRTSSGPPGDGGTAAPCGA